MNEDEHIAPQHNGSFVGEGATTGADAIAQARLLDPLSTAAASAALLSSSSCDTPDLYKNRSSSGSPREVSSSPRSSSPTSSPRVANSPPTTHRGEAPPSKLPVTTSSTGGVGLSGLNASHHFTISLSAPQEGDDLVRGDGNSPHVATTHRSLAPGVSNVLVTKDADIAVHRQREGRAVASSSSTPPSILLVEVVTTELNDISEANKISAHPSQEAHCDVGGGTPNVPTATSTHVVVESTRDVTAAAHQHDDAFDANLATAASASTRIPPEELRLLLLDQADREALVYADDHNARRRLAVLQRAILDHNEQVRRNVRAFFLSTTGEAANVPSTQPFTELRIPQRFIDPVTKRLISDPVVFADKRIMDRPSAEALVFRLFSTMLRCQTLGANKRQEYLMYCLDSVLVSSVAKQWRRQAFGFRGLELTSRPDIAASIREWVALQMSLCVDLRETIEREIQSELGITEVPQPFAATDGGGGDGNTSPTTNSRDAAADAQSYNIGATMMMLRDSRGAFGGAASIGNLQHGSSSGGMMLHASNGGTEASTNSMLMEDAAASDLRDMLQHVIVARKAPKEWDTLEHMWRDLCGVAIRWRKRKKKRSGSAVSLIRRSLDVMRKLSSVSPSPSRRGTRHSFAQQQHTPDSNQPQQQQQRSRQTSVGGGRSPSISHDANPSASHPATHLYRQTSPSIMLTASHHQQHTTVPTVYSTGGNDAESALLGLGVEIAGSTSFDIAEHLNAVDHHEDSARTALIGEEVHEAADLVAVSDQLRVAAVFEQQRSATGTNLLGVPLAAGRRRVSLASSTGRPISTTLTSPLASPLVPSSPGMIGRRPVHSSHSPRSIKSQQQPVKHHAVRHKVAVDAGANHRTPHRVVLHDVMGTMVVTRPSAVATGGEGNHPLDHNIAEDLQIMAGTVGSPLVAPAESEATPASPEQSPVKNNSGGDAPFVTEPFDLMSSLDSLTGLVSALFTSSVGRAQRSAAPLPKRGESATIGMMTEDVILVSATMRLHQDRELLDSAFEFSEKWFTSMEERCLKWATEQFTMIAEQQAKDRAMGSNHQQRLRSRAVLSPRSCVVSGGAGVSSGNVLQGGAAMVQKPPHAILSAPRSETSRRHNKSPPPMLPRPPPTSARGKSKKSSDTLDIVPHADDGQGIDDHHKQEDHRAPEQLITPAESQMTVVPSSAWRQRVADNKRLHNAAPLGQPIPPSLQFLVPPLAPGMTTTTTCGGGGIVLKPPWAAELERIRNKPSKSSNYIHTSNQYDALQLAASAPSGGGEELPSHELQKELEDLYMQFDLNTMQQEVLRKRELGPYYFEPLLFEDEVIQKNAARHAAVFSKLAHVTVPDLDLHWNRPTVATLFGYDAGGDGGGQRRAIAAQQQDSSTPASTPRIHTTPQECSPRLALPLAGGGFALTERVPLRPHSSSIGARSWAASTNYAVQTCGQDAKVGAGALLAATLRRGSGSGGSAVSSGRNSDSLPARSSAFIGPASSSPGAHRRATSGDIRPPTGRPPTTGRLAHASKLPTSARLPRISSSGSTK
jgi:hypothetical protein